MGKGLRQWLIEEVVYEQQRIWLDRSLWSVIGAGLSQNSAAYVFGEAHTEAAVDWNYLQLSVSGFDSSVRLGSASSKSGDLVLDFSQWSRAWHAFR